MKRVFYLLVTIIFLTTLDMYGQFLENDKKLLSENKVQSLTIAELFADDACLHQVTEYDKQGNETKYDLLRLDHYYRSIYDSLNQKVQELKVDKKDEQQVDSTFFEYDKLGSVVKETSVYYYGNERNEYVMFYSYDYNKSGKPIKQCQLVDEEGVWQEILLNEYVYDENGQLQKLLQYLDGEAAITEFYQYNEENLLVRKDVDDPTWFERVNMMKIKQRPNITEQYTSYTYNEQLQIIEIYQYFSDPCLSMDDYYAYRYTYLPNGLIEGVEVWEKRQKMVSKVRFDYGFHL